MIRNISIGAALNGFIVQCGCQTLVFSSTEDLTKALKAYLDNPDGEEKRMMKEGLNAKHTSHGLVADCDPTPVERRNEVERAVTSTLRESLAAHGVRGGVLGAGAAIARAEAYRAMGVQDPEDSVGGQPVGDSRPR